MFWLARLAVATATPSHTFTTPLQLNAGSLQLSGPPGAI